MNNKGGSEMVASQQAKQVSPRKLQMSPSHLIDAENKNSAAATTTSSPWSGDDGYFEKRLSRFEGR